MRNRNKKYGIKKTVTVIALLIIVFIVFIGGVVLIMKVYKGVGKVERLNPLLISQFYTNEEKTMVSSGALYALDLQKGSKEEVGKIILDYFSHVDQDWIVGISNMLLENTDFNGIKFYNIKTKEEIKILDCERIYGLMSDDDDDDFYGSVQYQKSAKKLFFICGGKLFQYKIDTDELEILFSSYIEQCKVSEQKNVLFYSENASLYQYNLETKAKIKMLSDVENFGIRKDEKLIAYESRKEKAIYLYYLSDGTKKKITTLKNGQSDLFFSDEQNYLIYTDLKGHIVPSNWKEQVYLYNIESGRKKKVFQSEYKDIIRTMAWW